jgi:hypothetical protein
VAHDLGTITAGDVDVFVAAIHCSYAHSGRQHTCLPALYRRFLDATYMQYWALLTANAMAVAHTRLLELLADMMLRMQTKSEAKH